MDASFIDELEGDPKIADLFEQLAEERRLGLEHPPRDSIQGIQAPHHIQAHSDNPYRDIQAHADMLAHPDMPAHPNMPAQAGNGVGHDSGSNRQQYIEIQLVVPQIANAMDALVSQNQVSATEKFSALWKRRFLALVKEQYPQVQTALHYHFGVFAMEGLNRKYVCRRYFTPHFKAARDKVLGVQ